MEKRAAVLTRAHVQIFSSKIESLQCELKNSLDQNDMTDHELSVAQSRLENVRDKFKERQEELTARYNHEIVECNKQIRLAEEVLARKREERQAMLDYLEEKKLIETSCADLKDFDWNSLKRIIQERDRSEIIIEKEAQAQKLSDLNLKARNQLNDLKRMILSTTVLKEERNRTFDYIRSHAENWKQLLEIQEKNITKLSGENQRLNLLIKQCAASNEPMSDYVAKNVRAKCHSFLNCENEQELLGGLTKFKQRQDRMIKLLKHEENKLSGEINQLMVAKDQTHDQMLYYTNIITVNKELNLADNMMEQRELPMDDDDFSE